MQNFHLDTVNIEGFKSFSEKTDMGFQPGIGVIIGNNGVGKSNILDAIVWALGENELERIRCYNNQELFFSGSKDYPPAPKIRVELILKKGGEKDAPTLQLAREKTRDGTDQYWISNKSYPYDSYRQKLDDFNLRHSLKTIIRQEQINDILQLNPWQRFDAITALLGNESYAKASNSLQHRIGPLLRRYMSYLIPLGKVNLDFLSQNGKKGLEIEVTLPGNRMRKAHQLSGGEKSITSLALKLAVFDQLESPFFLLDEVEPSLDYTNHKSMQAFLKDVATHKQLIMITHLRSTIALANTVHGVRTRWDGSSFMKYYFVMNERLLRLYKCC
ncbi:MAG: AAA family ATPase [Deltaproteobacteria bacterium]|nr:MAG: AAA family ATPase [Deltaproteobacteria bacterium]